MNCFICGEILEEVVCNGKKGRKAIMLSCPQDGRHFRGFINDPNMVKKIMESNLPIEEVLLTEKK